MRFLFALFLGMLIVSCANDLYNNPLNETPPDHDRQSPQEKSKVSLLLFSAPWCIECKPKINATESLLNNRLGSDRSRVMATIYVVEGRRPHGRPSDETTSGYAKVLGTQFNVVTDPWHWTNYQQFYTDNQFAVPGAVVQDANKKNRIFDRGVFLPEEVVAVIREGLK